MGKLLHEERFRHVDYHHTDVAKTFARVRKEQEAQRKQQEQSDADAVTRLHILYPKLREMK